MVCLRLNKQLTYALAAHRAHAAYFTVFASAIRIHIVVVRCWLVASVSYTLYIDLLYELIKTCPEKLFVSLKAMETVLILLVVALAGTADAHLRGAQTIERLSRPAAPVVDAMPDM